MNHIFIDLEFCTCFRKSSPLRCETIEIGAVKYDGNLNLVGEFDRLVRPDFADKIPPVERALTGITWKMVENEASFADVIDDFFRWVGTEEDYMIYSWSNTDSLQCLRESRVKGYPMLEMGAFDRWVDFQKAFMNSMKMKSQISLERALDYVRLDFAGNAHRAHVDAYNTARLFKYCSYLDSVSLELTPISAVSSSYSGKGEENDRKGQRKKKNQNHFSKGSGTGSKKPKHSPEEGQIRDHKQEKPEHEKSENDPAPETVKEHKTETKPESKSETKTERKSASSANKPNRRKSAKSGNPVSKEQRPDPSQAPAGDASSELNSGSDAAEKKKTAAKKRKPAKKTDEKSETT